MTKLYYEHPKEHWEAAIEEIEKKSYIKAKAKDLYKEGKLTNGQLFIVKEATNAKGEEEWCVATFMNGKFLYAHYNFKDQRIDTLKAKGIAHLLEIVKRKWVDTKQAPWLPSRIQSLKNPDLVIHGARSGQSIDKVLADGKDKKVLEDKEKMESDLKDIDIDVETIK